MTRPSRWGWFWLAWLSVFLVLDIVAGPQSLSRTLGRLFPRGVRRAILIGLLSLLGWHFWRQPDARPDPCAAWGCV